MRTPKRARGFTLIELMIAVAIIGILTPMAVMLLNRLSAAFRSSRDEAEIARTSNAALRLLAQDIRQSSAVSASWEQFSSSTDCLILKTSSVLPGSRLSREDFDHIVYARDPRDPSVLIKRVFPAPPSLRAATNQKLSTGLHRLDFSYSPSLADAALVGYETSFTSDLAPRGASRSFSSAAALRNRGLR